MKKGKLNIQPISSVSASLGHTDEILIADAGLPIPNSTQHIDLAHIQGIPTFDDTPKIILVEMCVEKVSVSDMITVHKYLLLSNQLSAIRQRNQSPPIPRPHQNRKSYYSNRRVHAICQCHPGSRFLGIRIIGMVRPYGRKQIIQ